MKKLLIFVSDRGCSRSSEGARLKDFASIEGVRDNQLIGYGIVVGLERNGRQTAHAVLDANAVEPAPAHGRHREPGSDAGPQHGRR